MAERCIAKVRYPVDEADFHRYSEALLASDPLLDENDSDDELHQ